MLELKKGDDILEVVGGISTITDAKALFDKNLDELTLEKMNRIKKGLHWLIW